MKDLDSIRDEVAKTFKQYCNTAKSKIESIIPKLESVNQDYQNEPVI